MSRFKDMKSYTIGNYRHSIYHSRFRKLLLRQHIIEQFEWRLGKMRQECYARGYCVKCGCTTTNLQMANEACKGKCYPPMKSKEQWEKLKRDGLV